MTNDMMTPSRLKSRGLGRGLSALLDDQTSHEINQDAGQNKYQPPSMQTHQPIDFIHPNKNQPRTQFSQNQLHELADSLREKGMIQPIIVRSHPSLSGHFQIIAGERRWRAAQIAGLYELPIILKETDDTELLELALIENIQRQDLNAIEEARSYQRLIDSFGHTQDKIAKMLGKSRSHIANSLRLNSLPDKIQNWVLDGSLSAGHARAFIGKEDPVQLAQYVIDHELNVRQAEKLNLNDLKLSPKMAKQVNDPDTAALMDRLSQALGMKVGLKDRHGKGQVRIDYQTLEELDFLIATLTGHRKT